jgi:hypothetical protein
MALDANSLLLSLAISSVGFVFFMYGKRQARLPQMVAGLALMLFPYFVTNLLAMALVAVAIVGLFWLAIRFGA